MKTGSIAILLASICFLPPLLASSAPSQRKSASAQDHLVKGLLLKYHLAPQETPILSYQYKHEFYSPLLGSGQQLPSDIEKIAIQQNEYLDKTTYFRDLSILRDGDKVRRYQLAPSKDGKETGRLISAVTEDGKLVEGTLLSRGSSTLVVIGGGFTHYREKMALLGDVFNNYDILFFDYRGHMYRKSKWYSPRTWRLLEVDPRETHLGLSEEKDVHAIVTHACKQKKYSAVVGIGVCYSGLIFVKTAALYPHLFSKLILDGCWYSLRDAVEILVKDPGMLARPQAHSKLHNSWPIKERWFQRSLMWLAQKIFNVEFNAVAALDYAPLLRENMPILFIHGKDDLLIPREQFEILFHATNCRQKAALITSNEHVRNYIKEKELYKEVVETFINTSFEQFSHFMVTPEAFIDYKKARLHALAGGR